MKNQIIREIPFNQWTRTQLLAHFGLRNKQTSRLLENWINTSIQLSDFELQALDFFGKRAQKAIDSWKEADLRDNFIGPIVSLVDFFSQELVFSSFSESSVKVAYKNIELKGSVEWMVAMGIDQPLTPFFFIHEYKAEETKSNADGRGQLLSMMFAAQLLNNNPTPKFKPFPWIKLQKDMPIYGSFVIGANWYFLILEGQEYSTSKAFNVTKEEELLQIFRILKAQKQLIVERIKALTTQSPPP